MDYLRDIFRLPLAPLRVPRQSHLPRVTCQSRQSVNDKGNNEIIPGAVRRSPSICLTVGKRQLEDRLMKAMRSYRLK